MAKFLLINLFRFFLLLTMISFSYAKECPPSSKIYTCSPRCYKDSDWASNAGKCCSDMCNQKSCVAPHLLTNAGSSDKYGTKPDKYGCSGSVYCGNVKCGPFEKCEIDRISKREKCVRA